GSWTAGSSAPSCEGSSSYGSPSREQARKRCEQQDHHDERERGAPGARDEAVLRLPDVAEDLRRQGVHRAAEIVGSRLDDRGGEKERGRLTGRARDRQENACDDA